MLVLGIVHSLKDDQQTKVSKNEINPALKNNNYQVRLITNRTRKYSSRIPGSRTDENVFGIRAFPFSKVSLKNEILRPKDQPSREYGLDFRIAKPNGRRISDLRKAEDRKKSDKLDIQAASAGDGKRKKEADEDDEKTLAQQVADGKYGLIQNEIFSKGSKRPGILSYRSNNEVPRDTKENLGGLEKDEIWLAEDHILVLRGGNYKDSNEKESSSTSIWPPIDDYNAPDRQVKIPKNPGIPPPFPVQLTENGPIEFVKGQNNPSFLPPVLPTFPPFSENSNKSIPFAFAPLPPFTENQSLPFPDPPNILPPFLSNLPPGATFVAPPDNHTDFDEDDPSIYYPPKYDFVYPQDNTTAVPPGPLVPGIILPPPPNFFSILENDTNGQDNFKNETDDSINAITPSYSGPKYLPVIKKPIRTRLPITKYKKIQHTSTETSTVLTTNSQPTKKQDEIENTHLHPINSKETTTTSTTTPNYNSYQTSIKVPPVKYPKGFTSPIFVSNDPNQPYYHALPTTSPKPNHITLPSTSKPLTKQILIITTPKIKEKVKVKEMDKEKYSQISPEIYPLRSLIKPNVTISYNGKYGHLPSPNISPGTQAENDVIRGHYITQLPLLKATKVPSTDINSISVTQVPVVKKVRIQTIAQKPETVNPPENPSKATFYFYDEISTTEAPSPLPKSLKPAEPTVQSPKVLSVKPEFQPVTPYYYKSTSIIPIRQFLEETFHASNVLSRKPQIAHVNNAEIITHNGYSDTHLKMKHLNYGPQLSTSRPIIKYHYSSENSAVLLPKPDIKNLEIKNSGSTGLQTVHIDAVSVQPAVKPIASEPFIQQKPKTETQNHFMPTTTTPTPKEYRPPNSVFFPSNYYATARPEQIQFTSQEQSFVDDLTKNYFTIFGQKINSPSTTPLSVTPLTRFIPKKNSFKQESGLSYISDEGNNYKIQQIHDSSSQKPSKSSTSFFISENPKPTISSRPSNFEKYLKELTGEDQHDYIISGLFPSKIKKGKQYLGLVGERIPSHLLAPTPLIIRNQNAPNLHQSDLQYQPQFSTTLRPVVNVEIKPQYVQHLSTTTKPINYQPNSQSINGNLPQNFQQYIQQLTGLANPNTKDSNNVKKQNNKFIPEAPPLMSQSILAERPNPISLEGDTLVNEKNPRPDLNPDAEFIRVQNNYDNIKIVESPDLSKNSGQMPANKEVSFDLPKEFFQNLPSAQYIPQPHQNNGNSFVSYNLPGNGGHFYFLTPQVVEEDSVRDTRKQNQDFRRENRSEKRPRRGYPGSTGEGYSSLIEHKLENGHSNRDYLRRRRKKP